MTRLSAVLLSTLLASTSGVFAQDSSTESADVIIENGFVFDGTGAPWIKADVAVSGDRILAIGNLDGMEAEQRIDATGLYVAPGFIDAHTHAGEGLATPELSHAQPLLAQGLNTVFRQSGRRWRA